MAHQIDINVNFGGQSGSFKDMTEFTTRLQTSIDNLNKTFQDFGSKASTSARSGRKALADYDGSLNTLTSDIKKNREELKAQLQSLDNLRKAQNTDKTAIDNKVKSIRDLETVLRKQTQTLNQYNKSLGLTSSSARQAKTSIDSLSTGFNKLGAVLGVSFGLYGAIRGLQYTIKTIADFDLAQQKLRSILAETEQGMNQISQSAIELGKSSIFGAKGVTELQIELAKMGFTKQQIMDMQAAIVNLATATQEDLASSAEVVANIIRTYNLTATDATHITDVMGKAFNDSALDLANFREAIKYVAPIASQANFTFEDTVALLEQLSNAGLKGSLAGTGLTNIISRLNNENSKFVKTVGHTVKNMDEFLQAMLDLKKGGADLGDTFELVDRRAAAAFTIIMEGVDNVEEFRKKLLEADGVMKRQTEVQLDTISYQLKIAKNSFDAFILSIDNGRDSLSDGLKGFIGILSSTLNLLTGIRDVNQEIEWDKIAEQLNTLNIAGGDSFKKSGEALGDFKQKLTAWAGGIVTFMSTGKFANIGMALDKQVADGIQEGSNLVTKQVEKNAQAAVKVWEDSIGSAFLDTIPDLRAGLSEQLKGLEETSLEYRTIAKEIEILDKLYEKHIDKKQLDKQSEEDLLKLLRERWALESEILSLEEALFNQREKELNDLYDYEEKLRRDKEKKMREMFINIAKVTEQFYEDSKKLSEEYVDDIPFNTEEIAKKFLDIEKFRSDNWVARLLGLENQDQLDAIETAFDKLGTYITGYADEWVNQTDRIVDARQKMVEEAQQDLETEIALAQAGFASNVTLKRNELAEAKKLRKEALEDQKKARKAQAALDTAEQASSLITASANIFEALAPLAPVGIPIAIALIGAMLGSFIAFRVKAQKAAEIPTFGKGGKVGGRLHSQGGTVIEAERDEYIVNRKSSLKHKDLIEAINNDNKVEIDRAYFKKFAGGSMTVRASLDDSGHLKAIRNILENNKEVIYQGKYRIEKFGNTTTKIRISEN